MIYAYFKEDMDYDNCPRYILNLASGFFEMEGNPDFSFYLTEVWGSPDFVVLVEEVSVSV